MLWAGLHDPIRKPQFRAITKAQKLRMWLGGGPNVLEDFPAKPSRMHRRTYDRLLGRLLTAQEGWVGLQRDYLRRHYPGVLRDEKIVGR
jgi:hypothetical protein